MLSLWICSLISTLLCYLASSQHTIQTSVNTNSNQVNQKHRSPKSRHYDKIKFVTVNTNLNQPFCRKSLLTALVYNVDVHVLGYNEDTNVLARKHGLDPKMLLSDRGIGLKIPYFLDYLERFHKSLKVVVFFDGYDHFFQNTSAHMLEIYTRMGSPNALVGLEKNCYPIEMECAKFPLNPYGHENHYINSGAWMGKSAVVYDMVKAFMSELVNKTWDVKTSNDQALVGRAYTSYNHLFNISLDHQAELFLPIHGFEGDLRFIRDATNTSSVWVNQRTSLIPAMIHFHGGNKFGEERRMVETAWFIDETTGRLKDSVWEKLRRHRIPMGLYGATMTFPELCGEYIQDLIPTK